MVVQLKLEKCCKYLSRRDLPVQSLEQLLNVERFIHPQLAVDGSLTGAQGRADR